MSNPIAEQATGWLQTLKNPAPGQHEAFVDWVRAAPEHLREFLLAMTFNQELGDVDWTRMPEVEQILAQADANVVSFPAGTEVRSPTLAGTSCTHPLRAGRHVAIAATLAVAAGTAWWLLAPDPPVYATTIGEQRQVELVDRSVVNLNSRSRIELDFSSQARIIHLDGEAMFKVAHDPARPFQVYSGNTVIQAVGTAFNVRRLPSGTTVSVLEGIVKVVTGAQELQLVAGEQARIVLSGEVRTRELPESASTAWPRNRLVFRDNTLEDIVAEFNRWNRQQIRIERGANSGRLYDGAFNADDPQSLLEFLQRTPGIAVEEEGESLTIRRR